MTPTDSSAPTVLIVAGEASGDLHAAALAAALRRREPRARLLGLGGPRMAAEGVENLIRLTDLAVMGFVEVLAHLRQVRRVWKAALAVLDREKPDVLVLVDYPGFNLRLARAAHRRGIRVVYYISPQLWAWHESRVETVRRVVDRMLVILPFEAEWYAARGVEAEFVGHPLVERIDVPPGDAPPHRPARVALLPGSRKSDWKRLFPALLRAAERIATERPDTRFLLPLADPTCANWFDPDRLPVPVEVVDNDYATRAGCDVAITKSGTATVEHALLGLPTVVVYATSPLTYWLARRLVKVDHIGMVNLIANERLCPELIQHEATPERIACEALRLLEPKARQTMRAGMARVRTALGGPGASDNAARAVLETLAR